MRKINNINRRKFLGYFGCYACGLLISSCASAPITHRRQLKLLPESTINRQAAKLYENVKKKTKLSDDVAQLNEIKENNKEGGAVHFIAHSKNGNIVFNKSVLKGSFVASDAFFPFPDSIDVFGKFGVKAIIQPGGSVKDIEVTKRANKYKIAMAFTNMRHFRH